MVVSTQPVAIRSVLTVGDDVDPGTRLDDYLGRRLGVFPSKKAAYKAAKRGEILCNGMPANPHDLPRDGDTIEIFEPPDIALPHTTLRPALHYCDPWLAVVHKPAGIPVMGLFEPSLELACATALPPSAAADPLPRAKPVHRLDVPTSGLVLVARTQRALRELSRQFRDREVRKTYRAVVVGKLIGRGILDAPLDGRPCRTEYACAPPVRSLTNDWVTPLTLHPHTGRTHQLRRHLADIGHPIVGDRDYGHPRRLLRGKGLFLAATSLCFPHPAHPWHLSVTICEPRKFTAYLEREALRHTHLAD